MVARPNIAVLLPGTCVVRFKRLLKCGQRLLVLRQRSMVALAQPMTDGKIGHGQADVEVVLRQRFLEM